MLPCTLPIFNSLYPHVHLDILESHSSQLEGMLLNGDADLAFFNMPVKSPDIDYEIICHEELLLILPSQHPLAGLGIKKEGCKYPWMDLRHLKDEPFLFQIPGQRTQQGRGFALQILRNYAHCKAADQQHCRKSATGRQRIWLRLCDRNPPKAHPASAGYCLLLRWHRHLHNCGFCGSLPARKLSALSCAGVY